VISLHPWLTNREDHISIDCASFSRIARRDIASDAADIRFDGDFQ
jgi:hypothetical protein